MTVVVWKQRVPRLSKLIDSPGGLSVGVALTTARANLEELRGQSDALIAEGIAALARLEAPTGMDSQGSRLSRAYQLAIGIIDAAGPYQRDDLCAAASNLCDVIDQAPTERPFDWRIVMVHAQAIRLMFALPHDSSEQRRAILNSLGEVAGRRSGGQLQSKT